MEVPCVRVPREAGEETRQTLDSLGVLDRDLEIAREGGYLYIPVTDSAALPPNFEIVRHEVESRKGQVMPADVLGYEPSYERLGEIVILHEDDAERAEAIAEAIMSSDLKAKTVINRASPIQGEQRVREWDVLRGTDTETVHREYGCEFLLDVTEVYFSPRLATERHRVIQQVEAGERVFDMFAGVGPFAVPMAKRGATVIAVDINERATTYLEENARRNGVEEDITVLTGDVREVAREYEDWADRIVMNLPHSADAFLETAVSLAGDDCLLHYYDIQHEDDPYGPGEAAVRQAVGDQYAVDIQTRRTVRSYAPHELNVCIDARLTRRGRANRNS